ncbi:MAG: TonB-dependent receptor domain-containing protein [Pyrinomonadaceae bacterium]
MKNVFRLIFFSLCLIGVHTAFGQTTNQGTIVGTVKDQMGDAIPAVVVSITNNETGAGRTATTDEHGNYRVDFLTPGVYRILAELSGFKKAELSQITVNVSDITRADIKMEIGQISEQVTVDNDTAGMVNTENATFGEVINENIIQNMPLNGREFVELSGLVPGVSDGSGKTGSISSKGVATAVGGSRSSYNSFYVDGADSTDNYFGQLVSSPALDAVKEFRVETSLYSARFGRAGGGVINVVTKSGTNDFHGSLYEFHRSEDFDAMPYFYTGPKEDRPTYLQNQYGGTIGGPVYLPTLGFGGKKYYSGKNRTFFFFSTEFYRQKKPGQFIEGIAPTALERVGNFTETINPYTNAPVTLVYPNVYKVTSTCPDPTQPPVTSGTPSAGQHCQQMPITNKILPANLINPLGQKLMDLIPEPNYDDPIFNLRVFKSGRHTADKYLIKLDHNFKDGSNLNGSYNYGIYDNTNPGITDFAATNSYDYGKTLAIGFTKPINRNLVSDTKFNYTWSDSGLRQLASDKNYAEEYGFWVGGQKPDINGFPRVQLYTVGNRYMTLGSSGPNMRSNKTMYVREDLIYIKGNHTISLGADFKAQDYGWIYDVAMFGAYYIGILENGVTSGNLYYRVTGHTFGNLLTGISSYSSYSYGDSRYARSQRNSIGTYLQDDWKVSDRLTMNLGLRYDFEPPFSSKDGKFMTLNWENGMPLYSKQTNSSLLQDLKFNYQTGGPKTPFDANKLNFAPRVGFALNIFNDNSTVLRGGFGLVYNSESFYTTGYGSFVAPFGGTFIWRTRAALQPDLVNHLIPMDQEPYQLPLTEPTSPGSTWVNPRYYPTGYVQNWNLGISREIGWGVVAETSYVGSKGTNLNGLGSLRSYDPALLAKAKENNPEWVTTGGSNVVSLRLKGFNSSYHSLQAKLRKRFRNGISFLGAYTWSHTMAEASNDLVDENLDSLDTETQTYVYKRIDTNADFDIRHRFTFSGTYDLPFGKGQHFGSDWNSFVNTLFGNWRLNMITKMQSGQPFSVRGTNGRPPNRLCDGNLPASERTVERWFDTSCFVDSASSTINGNASPNIIWGPNLIAFDFGLHKELKFGDNVKLQLRGEAFNAFNRVNLIGPSLNYFVNADSGATLTRQRDNRSLQFGLRLIF